MNIKGKIYTKASQVYLSIIICKMTQYIGIKFINFFLQKLGYDHKGTKTKRHTNFSRQPCSSAPLLKNK